MSIAISEADLVGSRVWPLAGMLSVAKLNRQFQWVVWADYIPPIIGGEVGHHRLLIETALEIYVRRDNAPGNRDLHDA